MKRLLLGPALVLPLLTLGFCGKSPQLPKAPEVVREIPLDTFEQRFPPINPAPQITAPAQPDQVKPNVRHGHAGAAQQRRHQPAKRSPAPAPRPRPPAPESPVETLPPQQGPICIFPLNFIPNCTPQEAQ